jgi:ABC-type multidrug transport system fused ATPase/permease subunit
MQKVFSVIVLGLILAVVFLNGLAMWLALLGVLAAGGFTIGLLLVLQLMTRIETLQGSLRELRRELQGLDQKLEYVPGKLNSVEGLCIEMRNRYASEPDHLV